MGSNPKLSIGDLVVVNKLTMPDGPREEELLELELFVPRQKVLEIEGIVWCDKFNTYSYRVRNFCSDGEAWMFLESDEDLELFYAT